MRWDVYCRVVDNWGDIGFAWRLAADLASRGEQVRLVADDASALAWMAPHGTSGVVVEGWPADGRGADRDPPADVVVETFGCGLPDAARAAPLVIDVEHLSAERYVERSHGLPSPRSRPDGSTATTWLYYPGFTPATGGLVREADLLAMRDRFQSQAEHAVADDERRIVVFGYAGAPYAALLEAARDAPTVVVPCAGAATEALVAGGPPAGGRLRIAPVPRMSQAEFDRLLWSATIAFVRGEDSLVRAIWSGRPFVWQIYAQADGAHVAKLEAFLDRFLEGAAGELAGPVRRLFRLWNGLGRGPIEWPPLDPWREHCRRWCASLAAREDLTTALRRFALERR